MPKKKETDLDKPVTQRDLISVTDTMQEIAGFIMKEMKKGFSQIRKEFKGEIRGVRTEIGGEIQSVKKGLLDEIRDFRREQREKNEELEKKMETNTHSINLLSKDLRKTQKLEFDIYNHEGRIKRLEKAR